MKIEECYKAGSALGRDHAGASKERKGQKPEADQIDWSGYIREAKEVSHKFTSLVADPEELLVYAEKEWKKAIASLPPLLGLPGEAMERGLECAGLAEQDLDLEKLKAFFEGYLEAYDNCFRGYSKLVGIAYGCVKSLGGNVQKILDSIAYIREQEPRIKEVLDSSLRKIDSARYDNHDEQICHYELFLENELGGNYSYPLPAGYRFVAYSEGDRDSWIEIEKSAKEFTTYEEGLEAWNCYYEGSRKILPQRMFFIENENGEKVATASAYYDIYGRDTSGDGWLHWVAVKKEYQGKGLSKPLITHVLNVMKDLGYTHAKIPTQTNTWVACKIYLNLGFTPVKQSLEHDYEGWRIVKGLTGHSAIPVE